MRIRYSAGQHPEPKKPYSTSLYFQVSNYLDRLNKSKIKQLGAALNIQLKYSKDEKTIELIKLEIRGMFRHSPQTWRGDTIKSKAYET